MCDWFRESSKTSIVTFLGLGGFTHSTIEPRILLSINHRHRNAFRWWRFHWNEKITYPCTHTEQRNELIEIHWNCKWLWNTSSTLPWLLGLINSEFSEQNVIQLNHRHIFIASFNYICTQTNVVAESYTNFNALTFTTYLSTLAGIIWDSGAASMVDCQVFVVFGLTCMKVMREHIM